MMKFQSALTAVLAAGLLSACGGVESELAQTEDELHGDSLRFRSLTDGSEIRGSRATLFRGPNNVRVR